MSKNFKAAATGADRFFSVNDTLDTSDTRNMSDTNDAKDTKDTRNTTEKYYRLNLKLDASLKEYLADEAWRQRLSITSLVNSILKEYKDAHKK